MELDQPDISQPEEPNHNHGEKKSAKKHRRSHSSGPHPKNTHPEKSLRETWEETINHKNTEPEASKKEEADKRHEHHRPQHEAPKETDKSRSQEIDLHPVDAQELHERVQEGRDEEETISKPDPVWEPWRPPATRPEPEAKAEQSVKDLAAPAAELRNETAKETNAVVAASPAMVENMPPAVEPPTPLTGIPRPELNQQSVNPNFVNTQPYRSEAFSVSGVEQTAPPEYRADLPKEAQEIMDRLHPSDGTHLEQSSWHNIEVDDRTGQAAENPSFSYGEAFQQEQRQETTPQLSDDEEAEVAVASGQLAVDSNTSASIDENKAPTEDTPDFPGDSNASDRKPKESNAAPTLPLRPSIADPVLWIILIVIVIAIIFAIVL